MRSASRLTAVHPVGSGPVGAQHLEAAERLQHLVRAALRAIRCVALRHAAVPARRLRHGCRPEVPAKRPIHRRALTRISTARRLSPWLTARLSSPMALPAANRWLVCSSTMQSCNGRPSVAGGTTCPVTRRITSPNSGENPGRRVRPQMSPRTDPASTDASWSRSPISTRRAVPGRASTSLAMRARSTMETSSMIIRSTGSGCLSVVMKQGGAGHRPEQAMQGVDLVGGSGAAAGGRRRRLRAGPQGFLEPGGGLARGRGQEHAARPPRVALPPTRQGSWRRSWSCRFPARR